MTRFKRWLIHKLGGICKDDFVQPLIVKEEKKLQKIRAEFATTFSDIPIEHIKKALLENLINELSKYYFEIKTKDLNMCYVYYMELEFVLQ